jgi:hypothetical protein
MTTAVTSLKQDAVLGKSVATLVRLKISLLRRSSMLSVRSFRQYSCGMEKTTIPSGSAFSAHAVNSGAESLYWVINS